MNLNEAQGRLVLGGLFFPGPLPSTVSLAPLRIQPGGTKCTGPPFSEGPKSSSPCRGHPAWMAQVDRQCTMGSFIL